MQLQASNTRGLQPVYLEAARVVIIGSRIERRYDLLKLGDQSILGGGILIVDDELQCRAPFVAVNHLLSEIETASIDEARALLEYEKVVARAPEKRIRPASIDL